MHTALRLSAAVFTSALTFVASPAFATPPPPVAPAFVLNDFSLAVMVKDKSDPEDKKQQVKYQAEVRGALIQNTAAGDAIRADFKKGGKTFASVRCVIDQREDDFRCPTKDNEYLTATGPIDIALTFLQDSTDKEFPLRTLHIKVLTTKVPWIQKKMYTKAVLDTAGVYGMAVAYYTGQDLTFEFWRGATDDDKSSLHDEDIRCSVNGKRIPTALRIQLNHDGDEVPGKDGDLYRYNLVLLNVARAMGDRRTNAYVQTDQYPGDWSCQYRGEGQVAREFRFKINADTTLAPHAEQTGPDPIHLLKGVVLLDQSFGNPAKFNRGFSAAGFRAESFYGRPWSKAPATAAMLKALEIK